MPYAAGASVGVSPVVPSSLNNRYSLPNKLFQYMAAAVPVIASDLPQVREIVALSKFGWCVDTGNADAVAQALDNALADPDHLRVLGANGPPPSFGALQLGERGSDSVGDLREHQ